MEFCISESLSFTWNMNNDCYCKKRIPENLKENPEKERISGIINCSSTNIDFSAIIQNGNIFNNIRLFEENLARQKYQSGKNIGIRKLEFVTKTQFLYLVTY